MAELRPFATVKQAAEIGGISSTEIGVPDEYFVRKNELAKTGKFDAESLAPYQPDWFVHLDAVKMAGGAGDSLTVTPESLNFTSGGESKDITIKTGDNWEIL